MGMCALGWTAGYAGYAGEARYDGMGCVDTFWDSAGDCGGVVGKGMAGMFAWTERKRGMGEWRIREVWVCQDGGERR